MSSHKSSFKASKIVSHFIRKQTHIHKLGAAKKFGAGNVTKTKKKVMKQEVNYFEALQ